MTNRTSRRSLLASSPNVSSRSRLPKLARRLQQMRGAVQVAAPRAIFGAENAPRNAGDAIAANLTQTAGPNAVGAAPGRQFDSSGRSWRDDPFAGAWPAPSSAFAEVIANYSSRGRHPRQFSEISRAFNSSQPTSRAARGATDDVLNELLKEERSQAQIQREMLALANDIVRQGLLRFQSSGS